MKDAMPELIESFLLNDPIAFKRKLDTVPFNDPDFQNLQTLSLYLRMRNRDDGHLFYPRVEAQIRNSLKNLPSDPELVILIISAASFFCKYSKDFIDSNQLLSHLRQYEAESLRPNTQVLMALTKWNFHLTENNYPNQLEELEKAFSLVKSPGTPLWLLLKTNRIESALLHFDLNLARKDLHDLEPYRHLPWYGLGPYELMYGWYLFSNGKYEEALLILNSYPEEKMGGCRIRFLIRRIRALTRVSRFSEVERLLDESEHEVCETSSATLAVFRALTTANYKNLRAVLELALKNFDKARTYSQEAIRLSHGSGLIPDSFSSSDGHFSLLLTELATGRARTARIILQVIDPAATRLKIEWARLHLLEGNQEKSFQIFKKFLEEGDQDGLKKRLQFSFELSPKKIKEILALAPSNHKKKHRPIEKSNKERNDERAVSSISGILIGKSSNIQEVRNKIEKFAPLSNAILISGETGCGKEIVANLLHQNSPRKSEPFIAINCGAIADTLIESELFGHVKGSFTGAHSDHQGLFLAAGKGTLFLDEISSMSQHLQSSLLRALENQEIRPVGSTKTHRVQARVIAATNESLDLAVSDKKFRKDLYFRLVQFHLHILPLRERREDIPSLANHFLKNLFADIPVTIGTDLIEALMQYDWPGNVRQLKNEMERIAFMAGDSQILNASLFEHGREDRPTFSIKTPTPVPTISLQQTHEISLEERGQYASSRLQRLRELFNQHPKLTRGNVIKLLNCSPNTAVSDLKILEEEKWIRRVNPSPSPRTSYFVRFH